MKVPHVIAELVSEFSGFQHTPDFKASRSTGNFEEDAEAAATSSDHSEHHGHSLYFGKHLRKEHLPPVAENEDDRKSEHSEASGEKHHKHHGLSAHLKELLHIGHHHHHHHGHGNKGDDSSKPNSGASTPARKLSTGSLNQNQVHKHSTHITVGADEVPTVLATPPNELHSHFLKNPTGSPSISRVASSSSLKEKLHKIKATSEAESELPEKKCSVSSYRLVTH